MLLHDGIERVEQSAELLYLRRLTRRRGLAGCLLQHRSELRSVLERRELALRAHERSREASGQRLAQRRKRLVRLVGRPTHARPP